MRLERRIEREEHPDSSFSTTYWDSLQTPSAFSWWVVSFMKCNQEGTAFTIKASALKTTFIDPQKSQVVLSDPSFWNTFSQIYWWQAQFELRERGLLIFILAGLWVWLPVWMALYRPLDPHGLEKWDTQLRSHALGKNPPHLPIHTQQILIWPHWLVTVKSADSCCCMSAWKLFSEAWRQSPDQSSHTPSTLVSSNVTQWRGTSKKTLYNTALPRPTLSSIAFFT